MTYQLFCVDDLSNVVSDPLVKLLHVSFLPLPMVGTVNLVTVGSLTILNQLVAGSIIAKRMMSMLVPSLPLYQYTFKSVGSYEVYT